MGHTIPKRRPTRLVTTKLELISHLKDAYRQHHDVDIDALQGANTAVGNPDDQIVRGFHETPDEHALDPVVSSSQHAYELGWDDGLREGLRRLWCRDAREQSHAPTPAHSVCAQDDIPPACAYAVDPSSPQASPPPSSTSLECGERRSTQSLASQRQIKSAFNDDDDDNSTSSITSTTSTSISTKASIHQARSTTTSPTSRPHSGMNPPTANMAARLPAAPHRTASSPLLTSIARKPLPPKLLPPPISRADSDSAVAAATAAVVLRGSSARMLAVRDKTIRLLGPLPRRGEVKAEEGKSGGRGEEEVRVESGGGAARVVDAVLMVFAVGVGCAWVVCVVGAVVLRR